jgi:hypothetical protein
MAFTVIISTQNLTAGPLEQMLLSNKVAVEFGAGNLVSAEKLVKNLEDPNIKQLWISNVIAKSMQTKQCDIGRA